MQKLKIPAIIIAIGLILSVVACLVANIVMIPDVKTNDFHFSVTYKLQGETKTLEGVYRCTFDGYTKGETPADRYYIEEYIVNGESSPSHFYTIFKNDEGELNLITCFNPSYLMDDKKDMDYEPYLEDPQFEAINREGYVFEEDTLPAEFKAEIISWEYPQPVANRFRFGGFAMLYGGSMLAMLLVGLATLLACIICVKRDKSLSYKVLDKFSILLNLAVFFIALPFITIVTIFMPISVDTQSFFYQMSLCLPAFITLTLAASISLRRKGFTISGFFIQLAGPVLFFAPILLEAVII